jgi:hypothetical protein
VQVKEEADRLIEIQKEEWADERAMELEELAKLRENNKLLKTAAQEYKVCVWWVWWRIRSGQAHAHPLTLSLSHARNHVFRTKQDQYSNLMRHSEQLQAQLKIAKMAGGGAATPAAAGATGAAETSGERGRGRSSRNSSSKESCSGSWSSADP